MPVFEIPAKSFYICGVEINAYRVNLVKALQLEANGYILGEGMTSDILALTLNGVDVSCINLPAGYHNPHKDDKYTVVEELEHCLAFVRHTVENLREKFPHYYWTETQRKIMGNTLKPAP